MAPETAINWQVKGHARQLGLLGRALSSDRLAHAYVFSGPAQSGKRTVAKRLAKMMICEQGTACDSCIQCRTFDAGSNADYMEIPGGDSIKIESVRDLAYKMALKPYGGRFKVALIDDAHNLTVEAANALLKVLEEPKPQTMMVLVTSNPHRLLPTILSRVQKVGFGPLEGPIAELSGEAKDHEDAALASFKEFSGSSVGSKLVLAVELAEQETPDLKRTLDRWLSYLQSSLRLDPSQPTTAKIKALMRAQRLLDQNVNAKLLLSEMMIASA